MNDQALHARLLLITAVLMFLGAAFFALSPSIGFLQTVSVNERVLTLADSNRDGILSVSEMRKSISAMITAIARNTLSYDLNGSGKTDKADLKVLIGSIRSFLSSECGNGVIEGIEQCDDGNRIDNDTCTGLCKNAACGDGFKQGTEQCDDGNQTNTDTCTSLCKTAACGDGFRQGTEQCDDGNQINNDTCTGLCKLGACGDGFLQGAEQCDDGNRIDTDSCTNICTNFLCGNGQIDSGEECDDGNRTNIDSCSNFCKDAICGDGIKQVNEICDDGNRSNLDTCTNDCRAPFCGNGILEGTEQCDDGNQDTTDACTYRCTNAICGDGIKAATEQCDDANQNNIDDMCTISCKAPACGDQYLGYFEECEDGNTVAGDGCAPAVCRVEVAPPALPGFTWTAGAPPEEDLLDGSLSEFTAIAGHGTLMLIGGIGNDGPTDAIYTTNGNFWIKAGTLPRPLFRVSAIDINETVWVIGGMCDANDCGNRSYYSRDLRNWTNGPSLPSDVKVEGSPIFSLNGLLFVEATTASGQKRTYSLDSGATSWQHVGGSMSGSAVMFRNKAWVLQGRSILSSTDGIHFTKVSVLPTSVHTRNETQNFGTLLADYNRLIVVGNADVLSPANTCNKIVLSSYDGVRWSKGGTALCAKPIRDHRTITAGGRVWLVSLFLAPFSGSPFAYYARIPLPTSLCGDGFRQADTEQCDDGNTDNGDMCTTLCKPPSCGDGFKQGSEQCDDGNQINTDACTTLCKKPGCGDSKVEGTEQCDDGNQVNTDSCTIACKFPACPDGYIQGAEQCDDGNQDNNDACTSVCKAPFCGDGFKQQNEQCDDGNRIDADACLNSCIVPVCGNGTIEGAEKCDDGTVVSGDGCSAICAVESNYHCFGAPSSCRSDRDRVLQLADTSHDGSVSEREALVMMLDVAESVQRPFDTVKHFDLNYDGKISQDDLQIVVFQLNSFFPN